MLREYVEKLCEELGLAPAKLNEKKFYPFHLSDEIEVQIRDLEPGVSLQAKVCACPQDKREDLFIHLMRANLLGQGTGGSRIGLDAEEKSLTLSLGLPYEMNYKTFQESIEDFVNYLLYWREEVAKFEKERII